LLARAFVRTALAAPLYVFFSLAACLPGSSPVEHGDKQDQGSGELSGCHGTASTSIPSNGLYDLTTFGGPGDSQPVACGGSTEDGTWWYAASSQRFGCGARLRIEANGKCVVAQVADYGPDACVERAAGRPIIDASPLVSRALFNEGELGWSDRAGIEVTEVAKSTPLGVCQIGSSTSSSSSSSSSSATTSSTTTGAGGNGGSSGNGGSGGDTTSASTGGGTPCTSDGDCNPGDDGSGMICTNRVCVPGCHHSYQCPGITTCQNGFCE
jgi:hypothetical protein